MFGGLSEGMMFRDIQTETMHLPRKGNMSPTLFSYRPRIKFNESPGNTPKLFKIFTSYDKIPEIEVDHPRPSVNLEAYINITETLRHRVLQTILYQSSVMPEFTIEAAREEKWLLGIFKVCPTLIYDTVALSPCPQRPARFQRE